MLRSVRGRVTLTATVVVALALLIASLLILRMVETSMLETTERALAAELELEASFIELGIDGGPQLFEFESGGQFFELGMFFEDDGEAFGSIFDPMSGREIAVVVIDVDMVEASAIYDPFTGETIADPVLAAAVQDLNFEFRDIDGADGNQLLVGAVARDEVDASLAAVRRALIFIVPAFTVLMGALIWILVGRSLRPVRAISDQVRAITTSSLDQRVSVPPGDDEISGLATVMNNMLNRLQSGDSKQRQFAADASHELRSPLSSVRAAAEIIERNPASDRAPGLAADIVAEADRMDTLIGDMLHLSRVDEDTAQASYHPVNLSDLAETFRDSITELTLDVAASMTVHGDEAQLRRVIENLLTNAGRHAHNIVVLGLGLAEHLGKQYAELVVEDDGQGVPEGQRATVFERFSRLDEARSRDEGGAGLGLALVLTIVTNHGGSVAVDASPGFGGARFTVHLPITSTIS